MNKNSKYDILGIRDYYPDNKNPTASYYVHEQVKGAIEAGLRLIVVSPTPYIPKFIRNIRYKSFPFPTNSIVNYEGVGVLRPQYVKFPHQILYKLSFRNLKTSILSTSNSYRARLIHSHYGQNGAAAVELKRKWKVPMLTSFYGYDAGRLSGKFSSFYRSLIEEGDLFIALSNDMKQDLIRLGFPRKKIQVHHLGIDIDSFKEKPSPKNEKFVFLIVARFDESKGIHHSIMAFAKLFEYNKDIEMRIIGNGPFLRQLVSLIKSLGLEKAITIKNNFMSDDPKGMVIEEMSSCNVFMLTSYTSKGTVKEGTPVVLMEAQASSKPCISTIHAGIPEVVIDNLTGYLVEEGDIDSIAEKMRNFLDDSGMAKSFGKKARHHIEQNFNNKIQLKKLIKLYEKYL